MCSCKAASQDVFEPGFLPDASCSSQLACMLHHVQHCKHSSAQACMQDDVTECPLVVHHMLSEPMYAVVRCAVVVCAVVCPISR
jgi:hypothetical protein